MVPHLVRNHPRPLVPETQVHHPGPPAQITTELRRVQNPRGCVLVALPGVVVGNAASLLTPRISATTLRVPGIRATPRAAVSICQDELKMSLRATANELRVSKSTLARHYWNTMRPAEPMSGRASEFEDEILIRVGLGHQASPQARFAVG